MLLCHPASQKIGNPLPRIKIPVHGPVQRFALRVINPVLPNPCGEHRMFYIHHKVSPRRQGAMYQPVNCRQILQIMQGQVRYHAVPGGLRVSIVLDSAHRVSDARVTIALPCHRKHPFAYIYAQHLCCPLLHSIAAVPAIATAQVQHPFALKRWKKRPQLLPFPRCGKPALAPGHLRILLKEIFLIVRIPHHDRITSSYP